MDLCEGQNGDGCGGAFPNKSTMGLCAKCHRLSELPDGSVEHSSWKTTKQCRGCGMGWKNLAADMCGCCSKLSFADNADDSSGKNKLAQTAVDAARAARAQAIDARLHKSSSVSSPLHSTEGLAAAKSNVNPASDKVFISIECRVKSMSRRDQNSTDPDCGSWGKSWTKSDFLSEVLDNAIDTLNNSHWTKQYGMALIRDEVELRWKGNKVFLPGTRNDTVGSVYHEYLTGDASMAQYYSPATNARSRRATGGLKAPATMHLELYVNKLRFLERHNEADGSTAISALPSRKRGRALTTSLGTEIIAKQQSAHGGVLQSSFIRTPRIPSGITATSVTVQLQKAHVTCDAQTGEVDISWPDDFVKNNIQGLLEKSFFMSGMTKNVYKLSIEGDLFVAKRFYDIGLEPEAKKDNVSSVLNEEFLKCELVRLRSAEWFLKKFMDYARLKSIEVASDIFISNGYLVREIGIPSPASSPGCFEENSAVWLVEPRRTKSVMKFSGTLVHPSRSDKVGITLCAFAHFVYEFSHGEVVLADIQGSPMNINGRDSIILFDMMTHSPEGDSGIGDHGKDGIKTFVNQHTCNYVCVGLQLAALDNPELSGIAEDQDDDTNNNKDND